MSQTTKEMRAAMKVARLLDVREVADRLNVSVPFVYKAVRERRMPVTRIGRSLRFDPAVLGKFIDRNTADERQSA